MRIARFAKAGQDPAYGIIELSVDGGDHPDTIATLTRIFPNKTDKSKATIYAYSDSFNLPIVITRFSPTLIRKRMVPGDTLLVQIIGYHENGFAFALCKGLM